MKVLVVHNHYQQPGGEDGVFDAETRLLESRGAQVARYTAHNATVAGLGPIALATRTVWNRDTYRDVRALLLRERPDVMHVHNTLPLISPAAHHAAVAEGVPVVQTLHNYRLLCPGANLYRDGVVCEDCLGKRVPYPGVQHKCYRNSRAATAAVAATLVVHRTMGTWTDCVNVFIALSEFSRNKFVEGGMSADRIVVKPNFVDPDPGVGTGDGGYALYVGRLSPEKGVRTLLAAWQSIGARLPLKLVGDGPLADDVLAAVAANSAIEWLGQCPAAAVAMLIRRATVLVCPSECYENFPLVVTEAFAAGTPVVAARIGALAELVTHGVTGRLFAVGDPQDLADEVAQLQRHRLGTAALRRQARAEFEGKYTAARNYELLINTYARAIADSAQRTRA